MEVLRVLSPPPPGRTNGSGLKSKSPVSKSSRSDGQENTPPLHPNLELPLHIQSPSISKSHRLSVSIPKTNSVLKLEEASIDPLLCHSDASVKVAVRVLSANENNRIVHKVSDQALTIGDRTFNFHSVFGPQANQVEVFESIGVPLVHNALAGYNTSLVSYGQTGTGKTHTMWGPPSAMFGDNSLSAKMGLVPRFFRMLFSEIEKRKEASGQKQINYQCRCSFLEIYNEQINDLLDPTQRDLQIREDDINGIHVENLTDEYVTCEEDVAQMLIKGLSNRKIGATSMNSKSSRSHVMFNFVLESWSKQPSSSSFSSSKSSRITFVDLAGLDMNESEGATKQCTKEERFVKKSLSRLGKLVNILSEAAILGKDQKVSYLGSSLTYLLQDTLGGNSKVTFLCHISSDMRSKSAILSTLRFGERANHIQNTPIINEISEDDVNGLSDQIRQLKEELIRAKSSSNSPSESFKGFNARRNLNLLRVSLNRSLILPRIDMESDEEDLEEADEEDVAQLCTQITNLHSSSSEETATLEEILETNTEVSPMKEPEPTLCSSPRIHIKPRKSIMSSLGLLSVAKDEIGGGGSLRSSIQSTKLSPTESLAASLHRGLNIIEEHGENNNSNPRKSFVSLSFEHLALKCQSIDSSQAPHSSDESRNFVCSSCKKLVQGKEAESKNDLGMQLVPVIENQDEENGSTKGESNASTNGSKREKELEALCAEQEAKIKHLTSLVELRRQGGVMQQSFNDGIKITESLRIGESENMTTNETEEYCLLEKIRNGVTDTNDEVEKERENWMESESKWICLTEELRQDLESSRIYAEKKEAELAQEKSCNAELEDALHRSILGHSRIVEHYADLQEGYNDLLERHRRVMEGINEVKRAALKAGKKGGGTSMAFAAALSAELSNVRIDREKERAQLKEQNRRLRIQLRDTAEAVHAAGELLVRLREAEEALSRSQEKCGGMEQEKEKLRKQMEKMKKKHMLDMATMKNYLAESRLPESALESYYHTEEEAEIVQEPARTHDNQSWRSAFAPAFE